MRQNTLYVSDLDMTLLNSDARLSSFAKTNINNFLKKGINFTVASARSVKSIQPMFEEVTLNLPIIEFNGAFISDLKTGNHKIINAIELPELEEINNILVKNNQNYFLSSFNGDNDKLYYSKTNNPGENWYLGDRVQKKDPRLTKTDDLSKHFQEKIICFTIIGEEKELEPLVRELEESVAHIEIHFQENPYSPGWYWLTAHSHFATKDQAIFKLLQLYNMTDANVVVFGDNTNDIKMLKYASKGVAVENACPELKEIADIIIGSNDDNSVIEFIAKENNVELIKD